MKIKRLEFTSFRNYETLELNLGDECNIFYGNNAQGKTNILEGIYLSCTTKSHKKSKDREMIRFGDEEAHIRVYIEKKKIDYRIDMHLKGNVKKHIAINGQPVKRAADLLGIANIIFFSPEDISMIKSAPSERRRFVDMDLSQLDSLYLNSLSQYSKTLEQKNKILRDATYFGGPSFDEMLDVWDEKLLEYGEDIIRKRSLFIEELNGILKEKNKEITGVDEELSCIYEPDASIEEYREKLLKGRKNDLKSGSTSTGPHRDDIRFSLDGTDLRKYGSQGQQRSASLSVKLSEIELVKKRIKDTPILMLDDVLSELDSTRQKCLLNSIGEIQTLITCTGLDELIKNDFIKDKVFYVENATVIKKERSGIK
ncbi:MAG: DNA replication/repair protein RecF [Lachnospiraceae bacterium]|nr:DNA replication/repair protein RecF [Lachnospiraceae bacterium]